MSRVYSDICISTSVISIPNQFILVQQVYICTSVIVSFETIQYSTIFITIRIIERQECIPVGCVPAAFRPYAQVCFWGGCLVRGVVPGLGGVCSGGVSGLGGAWLGGCLLWGVPGLGGCGIPACTEAEPPL